MADRPVYEHLNTLMLSRHIDGWCNPGPGAWELFVAPGTFDVAHKLTAEERDVMTTNSLRLRLRTLGLDLPDATKERKVGKPELVAFLRKLVEQLQDPALVAEANRLLEAA